MHPTKLSEERILDGHFRVEKALFERNGKQFPRYRLDRTDAACVLLWNPERDQVILTKQFRYPVSAHQQEFLVEIVAGKVDEGETPERTATREVEEETGYKIDAQRLIFCTSGYVSPGYTTERFHIYIAKVGDGDKQTSGGGLEEESEEIELVTLPVSDFLRQVAKNQIADIKTVLAAKFLEDQLRQLDMVAE